MHDIGHDFKCTEQSAAYPTLND